MSEPSRSLRKVLPLLLILAVSGFFHLYRLGRGEFLGEDEAQVMIKVTRELMWQEDLANLGAILTSSHPPIRMLLPLPLVGLFGASELWLRLPGALAGVAVCYWTYRLGQRLFSRRTGLLAALVMAASGMSGVYRSVNGIGEFTLLILVALECLLRFDDAVSERREKVALAGTALALAVATWTFLDGVVFLMPVVYVYARKARRVRRDALLAMAVYWFLVGAYVVAYWIGPIVVRQLGLVPECAGGNLGHLAERLSALGAFNVAEMIGSLVGVNSVWLVSLVALTIPWGWRTWDRRARMAILFFLPHILVWLLVVRNPCGHTIYSMPLWGLLSAHGAGVFWSRLDCRWHRWVRVAAVAVALVAILLAGWHTYMLFLQDELTRTQSNLVWYDDEWMSIPCGVPFYVQLGQPGAGVYIRHNASPEDTLLSGIGGSLELYYAGRPPVPAQLEEVVAGLDQPDRMRDLGIHYLVLRANQPADFAQGMIPAALITVGGEPSLLIYDLWDEGLETEVLAAEALRPEFYSEYAHWRTLRPYLTADTEGVSE